VTVLLPRRGSIRGRGGGGSATGSAWTQFSSTVEGTTCSDPGGLTSSSSFDGDLFDIQLNTTATTIDGYRENTPRWTANLLALYPDFDPDLDVLECRLDVVAMPSAGTTKVGVYMAVLDSGTLASGDGSAVGFTDNAAGAHQQSNLGTTSITYNGAMAAVGTRLHVRWEWDTETAPVVVDTTRWKAAGEWQTSNRNSIKTAMTLPLSDWRFVLGAYRIAGGAGAASLQWRAYHRRIRVGSLT
jgi:hypothetical protein